MRIAQTMEIKKDFRLGSSAFLPMVSITLFVVLILLGGWNSKGILWGLMLSISVFSIIISHSGRKKVNELHMLLGAVLTPELVGQTLRRQAALAFSAFDEQHRVLRTSEKDSAEARVVEARVYEAKRAFWTMHSSFASLGIPLKEKISDYS